MTGRRNDTEAVSAATDTEPAGTGFAPWEVPAVALPRYVSARWCNEVLGTPEGDRLVRANVVTHSREPGTRMAWKVLWQMISFEPRWRAHVSEMLRADRDQAERALEAGLTGKAAGRARDYINNVDGALARMKREAGGPLGWASATYAQFAPDARDVIEALALAIDDHRAGRRTNEQLYQILADLDLDPTGRDVPAEARSPVEQPGQ